MLKNKTLEILASKYTLIILIISIATSCSVKFGTNFSKTATYSNNEILNVYKTKSFDKKIKELPKYSTFFILKRSKQGIKIKNKNVTGWVGFGYNRNIDFYSNIHNKRKKKYVNKWGCGTHNGNTLYRGSRGGCYYLNSKNNKIYVDRNKCNCN